jgi:hypothetical protein
MALRPVTAAAVVVVVVVSSAVLAAVSITSVQRRLAMAAQSAPVQLANTGQLTKSTILSHLSLVRQKPHSPTERSS